MSLAHFLLCILKNNVWCLYDGHYSILLDTVEEGCANFLSELHFCHVYISGEIHGAKIKTKLAAYDTNLDHIELQEVQLLHLYKYK